MENKETSPLLDNRIDELMMSFGNSMSQGKFKNGEMSSVLISLLDKCTVVLNDVPTESDQYSYNLDIVIKSIAYSANHAIKNMGNQDALYIPITGLQYGKSLADEYKILFSKINSLQIQPTNIRFFLARLTHYKYLIILKRLLKQNFLILLVL